MKVFSLYEEHRCTVAFEFRRDQQVCHPPSRNAERGRTAEPVCAESVYNVRLCPDARSELSASGYESIGTSR